MRIRFCCVCLNYELRHRFMVSSLLQQVGDIPDVHIDTAVLEGAQNPERFPADAVQALSPHLSLRYYSTERETFAKRGLVRNEQLARAISAGAEWIWFADCDRVYHPDFVAKLTKRLRTDLADCALPITYKWRFSTDFDATVPLIAAHRNETYIQGAYALAAKLPIAERRFSLAASGGMQVCRVGAIIAKTGGVYVNPRRPRDKHLFEHGQRAFSDLHFRKNMGGSVAISLPRALHLEHNRDKEQGHHIEEQR